ncbi:4-fold beta flower protein [Sediminibacterium soli]|uniref:4-fold beta flower protein n=1 Tax=Sediminibacterium soli TaxID=2698829 RepID=UPI00137B8779|nr:hypothetical protein [Sediminibacterium soli]NCI45538.1 hypothetical protein [Sediminibacterium soli]
MQALYNHAGEVVAYQYQHMLVHPDNLKVLGLILGNCVFSNQANMLGKLFQQKVYNLSGEVLASKDEASLPLPQSFDTTGSIMEAWQILVKIRDHSCPWVTAKNNWSHSSLGELLYAD